MCEGSEVSPQLQAKCCHFCWHEHEMPRSETKGFVLHAQQAAETAYHIRHPCSQSHGQTQVDACKRSGCVPGEEP